jgi:hypothetical protein
MPESGARGTQRSFQPHRHPALKGATSASRLQAGSTPARQDEAMVVRSLSFMVVRLVLSVIGLGPSPDAKDVEIAVLRRQLAVSRRQVACR